MSAFLVLAGFIAIVWFVQLDGRRDLKRLLAHLERRIPDWADGLNDALVRAGHALAAAVHLPRPGRSGGPEVRSQPDSDPMVAPTQTMPGVDAHVRASERRPFPAGDLEVEGKPYYRPSSNVPAPGQMITPTRDAGHSPHPAEPAPPRPRPAVASGGPGWGIREQTKPFTDRS